MLKEKNRNKWKGLWRLKFGRNMGQIIYIESRKHFDYIFLKPSPGVLWFADKREKISD